MPSSACKKSADRKSTRLNSSHTLISYAVFCLKKKDALDHGGPDERRGDAAAAQVRTDIARRAERRGYAAAEQFRHATALSLVEDFFYNDPRTPEIYPFPLHDALRI